MLCYRWTSWVYQCVGLLNSAPAREVIAIFSDAKVYMYGLEPSRVLKLTHFGVTRRAL